MSALEFRWAKGWGRIEMPGGSVSFSCDMCRAHKKQHPGGGTKLIFCLGRPFMRVCRKCEKGRSEDLGGGVVSDLANYCREADADSLGEFLRGITFPGEGLGCYSTFDVREGAEKFDRPRLIQWWDVRGLEDPTFCAEMGQGWTFPFDDLTVDAAWFWDGDGYLTFGVFGPNLQRFVANDDCKKDYCWEDDLA